MSVVKLAVTLGVVALLKRMAPKVDVTETLPSVPVVPAVSMPTAMLSPALIVMLPPPVVRLPSGHVGHVGGVGPGLNGDCASSLSLERVPEIKKYDGPVRGIENKGPSRMIDVPELPSFAWRNPTHRVIEVAPPPGGGDVPPASCAGGIPGPAPRVSVRLSECLTT